MRDYSKFYTPKEEAKELIALAAPLVSGMKLLEPSFGQGSLIRAAKQNNMGVHIVGYEIQYEPYNEFAQWITSSFEVTPLRNDMTTVFNSLNLTIHNKDFLAIPIKEKFDRIVANPPFDGDKWVSHLIKMFYLLTATGKMVCIVPRTFILTGTSTSAFLSTYFGDHLEQVLEIDNWATNNDGSEIELNTIIVKKG